MREHFNVPDRYFLSHSVGCLPKRAPAYLGDHFLAPWQAKGGDAWPDWMQEIETFRARISALLATDPAQICPQTNVSSGLTKILYALPETGRKTILCTELDFPSIGFVLKQAERAGFRLRFVQGDLTDASTWAGAMDSTVGAVLITHAFSNTSQLMPVEAICRMARSAGAISIVDIAQSAGIVPIDVTAWGADFAIGTGVKFLCCGPGACYLYAAPKMVDICQPLDVGWFSHEDPFEMDIHDFRYASSAMRFFGGTPSPAPIIMANAALALWDEVGVRTAQTRAQALLSVLTDHAAHLGVVSPLIAGERGGTLVLNPPKRERLRQVLGEQNVLFDERREGFRFSVHGYTSDNDIQGLSDAFRRAD